jgi:hypothetical protein
MAAVRQEHPDWCHVKGACDAHGGTGAHRSRRFIIDGLVPMEANLYALDAAPAVVFVEICGGETTVLPVRSAYGLGLALVSLGKAGGGAV